MTRPIDPKRASAIARIARHAAERYGLDARAAKAVARYALGWYRGGASAARAIAQGIRYARGRALWI